jgi:hypothetical protein
MEVQYANKIVASISDTETATADKNTIVKED